MAEGELKRIRTYESDVAEVLKGQNISLSKIALAESEKKRKETETILGAAPSAPKVFTISQTLPLADAPRRLNWRVISLLGTVLLLIAGVGTLWRFFGVRSLPQQITEAPPAGEKSGGNIVFQGGESRSGFLKAVRKGVGDLSVPLNELRTLSVRIEERGVTTEELFAFLQSRAPAPLIRALDETPFVGVHGIRGNQLFLLFKVDSFDHAFDGMLAWERTLLDDAGPLFGVTEKESRSEPATTTAGVLQNRLVFKDMIIRNKDARAVFDTGGRILFLYSFLGKETLLITTNEETLKVVLPKVSRGRLR